MNHLPDNVMLVNSRDMPQLGPVQLVDRHPDDEDTPPADIDETALSLGEPVAAVIHRLGLQDVSLIAYRTRFGHRMDNNELVSRVDLTLMYLGQFVWLSALLHSSGHMMLANTAWARAMLGMEPLPDNTPMHQLDKTLNEEIPF